MASKATSMVDSFPCRMAAAPVYGSTNSPTDPAGHTASPLMLSYHFPPGPSSQHRPSYPAILQPANDPDKQDLHRHRPLRPRRPARATTVDRGEPRARRDLQAGPRRDTRPGTVARPTRTTLRHLPASRADHPVLWVAAELDQRHVERAERVGARLSTRASRSWPPGSRGYGPTDERPTDRIFMHRRSRGECPHLPPLVRFAKAVVEGSYGAVPRDTAHCAVTRLDQGLQLPPGTRFWPRTGVPRPGRSAGPAPWPGRETAYATSR